MDLVAGAFIVLASGFGGFIGAYLKRKGENLASKEDIGDLVKQVSAVTEATKKIEAEISGELWNRQKRWELKREVLFEATKKLADVEDGLLSLDSVLQVEVKEPHKEDEVGWVETKHGRITKWRNVSAEFDEARLLVLMACDKETIRTFEDFGAFVNTVAAEISPKKDAQIYRNSQAELFKKRMAIRAAVRKELAIDP